VVQDKGHCPIIGDRGGTALDKNKDPDYNLIYNKINIYLFISD
jgi:hypothetical protein